MGSIVQNVWIGAGITSDVGDPWREMTDEETARQAQRVQRIIDTVAAKSAGVSAVATPRGAAWWSLPECSSLHETVNAAVGVALESGFPGDSIPHGMDWETLVDAGLVNWCSWYSTADSSATIVEVYVQPGAGAPSAKTLADTEVRTWNVAGADAAWMQVEPNHPESTRLVAVVGPNRLTLHMRSPDPARVADVAAALLARLG